MLRSIVTDNAVTLFLDGTQLSIPSTDDRYGKVIELLRKGKDQKAFNFANAVNVALTQTVSQVLGGVEVKLEHGKVFVDGELDVSGAAQHIVKLAKRGLPYKNIMAFLARVSKNPSYRARNDLFDWIIANDMPIGEDGRFIAFKVVRGDLWDIYTGNTFHHAIGARIEMPRNKVDEDPDRTCSAGAHFCAEPYIVSYGSQSRDTDVVCVLAVDPAEVVSFPKDYGLMKARASAYEVIEHITREQCPKYFEGRSRVSWPFDGAFIVVGYPDVEDDTDPDYEGDEHED